MINEIQKSINQIGYDAVCGVVAPIGHLNHCDIHGHYAVEHPGITDEPANDMVMCPLCIQHNPGAEGTPATEVELFIDLKDSLQAASTIINI